MVKKKDEKPLQRSTIHMLHRASQGADDLLQEQGQPLDLTPRQFAVLEMLSNNDGASQRMLVDATGIDRSTMADIIQRMLKKGFVKRKRSADDARAYAVKLSDSGARALKATRPVMRKIDQKLLAVLPQKRAQEFLNSLEMIVSAFEVEDAEPEPAPKPRAKKPAAKAKAKKKAPARKRRS